MNTGAFWLSNVHEMLSFVPFAEDLYEIQIKDDYDFARVLEVAKHDLESLEFDVYHTWMKALKRKLRSMIVPAVIESQPLVGLIAKDGDWLHSRFLHVLGAPYISIDDLLGLLSEIYKALQAYLIEKSIITQAVTELLKLVGVTAFNDLLQRKNFLSRKRGLQINHNIKQIQGWCERHDVPEGKLQLEHMMVRVLLSALSVMANFLLAGDGVVDAEGEAHP